MTDEPATQAAIDEAAEAPARYFHGIKLQPYSFKRDACWLRCRMDGYGSVFEAAVFMVFISTLGDEIVDSGMTGKDVMETARGRDGVLAFHRRCEAWADEHGITSNNAEGAEIKRIADEIWAETESSRFKAVTQTAASAPPNV